MGKQLPGCAMKATSVYRVFVLLLAISAGAVAQFHDVQISASPRKLDEQKNRQGGNVTVTTKEIVYKVTLENRSFKAVPQLQVKYMIFYADPKPDSNEKPVEAYQTGNETLADLASNRSATFETKPLKLSKEELDAGWYWVGSGKSRLKDRVTGVWIRAYSNGNIVGEVQQSDDSFKKEGVERIGLRISEIGRAIVVFTRARAPGKSASTSGQQTQPLAEASRSGSRQERRATGLRDRQCIVAR